MCYPVCKSNIVVIQHVVIQRDLVGGDAFMQLGYYGKGMGNRFRVGF